MEWAGYAWTEVLGLFAVSAAMATGLYLLKLRRRPIPVAFVGLWRTLLQERRSSRLFSSLRRILSWLLILAILACLAIALGDPRSTHSLAEARSRLVLVDISASMQARDISPDRLHRARDEAHRLIRSLRGQDRLLIAEMGQTTVPLTPFTNDRALLRQAVDQLVAHDSEANLAAGLRFASDVLGHQPHPELVLISDASLDAADAEAEALRAAGVTLYGIRTAEGGRNVAIRAFAVRRYPLDRNRSEGYLELWNPGDVSEDVELTLIGDGTPIEVQRFAIQPGEHQTHFLADLSNISETLEAQITLADGERDDQPADDYAYARVPTRQRTRVQVVSRNNLYLSAALLLDSYLDVTEVSPEAYVATASFDITIFDDWVPPRLPEHAMLFLNPSRPSDDGMPFVVTGESVRPFFDRSDRRHPILRWLSLRDINIVRALQVELQAEDQIIAGQSDTPLIVLGQREAQPMVALLFDPRESDLPLRVAWPLLLLNIIDHFVEDDDRFVASFRAGERWSIPLASPDGTATLRSPRGEETQVPVYDGRAVCSGNHAGFYQLVAENQETTFAVNLAPGTEAELSPPESWRLGDEALSPPEIIEYSEGWLPWIYFVIAIFCVLWLEWFTYQRRWTV